MRDGQSAPSKPSEHCLLVCVSAATETVDLELTVVMPDTQKFIARLVELHGGWDQFEATLDERFKSFNSIWEQDAGRIGRVLRAHLAVEHFLGGFISFNNPHLPPLENVRLTFNQKLEMLPDNDPSISPLKQGLRRLNTIRNRMAHRLKVEISEDDRAAILAIPIYRAMRDALAKGRDPKPDDPLSVLEDFAMFAASLLNNGSDSTMDLWAQAISPNGAGAQDGGSSD